MKRLFETGSAIRKMWTDAVRLKQKHGAENVADATLGNPVSLPPPELVDALIDIATNPPADLHRYTANAGHPEVRAKIAASLHERGLLPGAGHQNLVLTCGASAATNVILRAVLEPGDQVVVLAPCFPDYHAHIANHHGEMVMVPTAPGFLPDIEAIERALGPKTRAVIVNHPNNPSGRLYPEALLRDLAALLAERTKMNGRPVYLISDEPYREILFVDEPFVSPASVYEYGLMAYSYSKSLSIPGERIGYVAVNPACPGVAELVGGCALANRILGFTNAPSIWQFVIARCLDVVVDVGTYRRHRDHLLAALKEKGYELSAPEGAFYLFPKTPGGDDAAFIKRAMEQLLLIVPGATFAWPGHFRVALCVDDRTARLVAERLPRAD